jgi:glutamate-1-semialdehyde aminotransferase
VDFCLGNTGAMCGHAVPAISTAVSAQLARGATLMLPTVDAEWVGAELAQRFGLPYWDIERFLREFARFCAQLRSSLRHRS